MGSFRDRYDEMKSKYGLADIDQSKGGNDRSSKFRNRYDEMKSKYGLADIDQVETKAEETQDVVKGKPILESVERDDGIFSMQVPQKKAQTAPEETPAAGKPVFDRDQWLQDYAKEAERIFSPDQQDREEKKPEETPAPVQQSAPKSKDEWQALYNNSTSEMERLEKEWQALTDKMSGGMPSAEDQQRLDELQKQYKEAVTNRDAADNQLKQIGNNEVMRADLEILASWPEEDRQMLIQYALNDHKGRSVFERSSESATRAATALVELQKKYDKDTINRLSESYQWYQNEIATNTMRDEAAKEVQGKPGAAIVHSALTLPATVAGTVTAPLDYLGQVFSRTGRYSTLDPNARGNLPNVYSGAVRQQVASDIAGDGSSVGRMAASYLYQGGMSALDTGARLMVTGGNAAASATLAALGSFGNTVSEASAQGATPAQAMAYGIVAAGIEVATEKMELDELVGVAKGGWKGLKPALVSAFKQAGVEVAEEELSLIGTTLMELLILQEKASTNQRIQQLVAEEGMSVEEANNQVMYELLGEAMDTAVVSAISGGLSSAGGSVVAYAGRDTGGAQTAQEGAEASKSQETTVAEVTADTAADQQQTQVEEPQSNVQKAVQEFRDTGKVSNRMAEVILNDAESVAALQKETGMELPDTASGRRNAVKDAVAQLSRNEDAKDLTSSTAEALLRKQEQPQEAKAEDPEKNRRLAIEATRELQGLTMQETVENVDTSLEYRNGLMDQESGEKPRESVGAAPAGFAGKFQQLQAEYGNLPAGENPVRPDDMPKSTDGRDRVSQTAVTVKGAKVTPDEFVPLLEQKVTEGAMSYIPITNDQTVQKAMDDISQKGWTQAVADWKAEVNSGKAGADLTATGAILLNHAANAGDKAAWLDILYHYRMLGTNTAQGLQAMRILKTLEPSDKLYMVRESVRHMARSLKLKHEIKIDPKLAKAYKNAQTDREADQILKEITKDVARQIPATIKDKWTALRYLNMLGNLRTQVRNIAGNTGAGVTYWTKDEIGAALEHIFLKKENRTKSFAVSPQQLKAANADFDTVKNVIQNGGKYNDVGAQKTEFEQMVQDQRQIFRFAPLEGYRKATNWAMEKGDVIFSKAAYARALAGFLKARGIQETDYSKIDSKLMDDARLYAIKQAQEATFRDDNWLSKWVGKVGRRKDTPKAIKAVSEGVVPFRKTPANVLVRAEEFSPLGIINSAVKSIQAAKGNITGAELVDSWAKSLTGVGLYALGLYLGSLGMLTGGPDEDEDKEYFDQLNGYQNYALQLPGGLNFTIDFLSPMAIPMFLGAQTQKILDDGNTTLADWEKLFTSITDPLIQMSMLQGVSDTLDDINDNNLLQFALNAMMSYLGQGLTNTMLGQIERSTEDKRMTTYVDKESNIPVWLQKQLGKMSAKTPFWDFQQTPYINEWGEEERNPEGIKNWLYQMLSPSYIDKVNVDNVEKELYRLNEVQDEVNVFPDKAETTFSYTDKNGKYHENYQLSMEEAEKLQRVEGQTKAEIVSNLISSKDWKAMTDAQKASAISFAYNYASERARVNAISDYGGFSKAWMMNIRGKEADTIIRKVVLGDISESMTAINKALDENWNTAEAAGNMETAWKAYSRLSSGAQAEIRKEAGESAAGKYIDAREAGVTNAEYVTVLKNVAGLKPQSGYKNVREIQQAQAVGKMSGLSNAEKEAMIRGYVSDGQDQNIDDMKDLFRDKNRSFSVNDYLTAWAISDKESGKGRKDRIIAEYRKRFNLDEATAEELYKIFG